MEIISGEKKGHKIKLPVTLKIRPTSSRVRESLFNILEARNFLTGARVLDLYCGVGSLGLEALSRGAKEVLFVDRSPFSIKYTIDNIKKLKYENRAKVRKNSVLGELKNLVETDVNSFDLVIADPPYDTTEKELYEVLSLVSKLLKDKGIFVLEHSSKMSYSFDGFRKMIEKKYGDTALSFFQQI